MSKYDLRNKSPAIILIWFFDVCQLKNQFKKLYAFINMLLSEVLWSLVNNSLVNKSVTICKGWRKTMQIANCVSHIYCPFWGVEFNHQHLSIMVIWFNQIFCSVCWTWPDSKQFKNFDKKYFPYIFPILGILLGFISHGFPGVLACPPDRIFRSRSSTWPDRSKIL